MAASTKPVRTGAAGRPTAALDEDDVTRLRFVLLRLSRRLRQESTAGITPSQLSALSIIGGIGPLTIGDLAEREHCLLYTSPSPRDRTRSRMPSSA